MLNYFDQRESTKMRRADQFEVSNEEFLSEREDILSQDTRGLLRVFLTKRYLQNLILSCSDQYIENLHIEIHTDERLKHSSHSSETVGETWSALSNLKGRTLCIEVSCVWNGITETLRRVSVDMKFLWPIDYRKSKLKVSPLKIIDCTL